MGLYPILIGTYMFYPYNYGSISNFNWNILELDPQAQFLNLFISEHPGRPVVLKVNPGWTDPSFPWMSWTPSVSLLCPNIKVKCQNGHFQYLRIPFWLFRSSMISCYIILCHITSYYIILYHIISYYIILYHIISYYIILYHITSHYTILYRVISYDTISYPHLPWKISCFGAFDRRYAPPFLPGRPAAKLELTPPQWWSSTQDIGPQARRMVSGKIPRDEAGMTDDDWGYPPKKSMVKSNEMTGDIRIEKTSNEVLLDVLTQS